MDKIAVRTVDFADLVSCLESSFGCFRPCTYDGCDIVATHFLGGMRILRNRNGAGGHPKPGLAARESIFSGERRPILHRSVGRCFSSRMTELNSGNRSHRPDKIRDAAILHDMAVIVDAGAIMGLASTLFDSRLIAKYDACAAHCEFAEMHEMPICRPSGNRPILAHR